MPVDHVRCKGDNISATNLLFIGVQQIFLFSFSTIGYWISLVDKRKAKPALSLAILKIVTFTFIT